MAQVPLFLERRSYRRRRVMDAVRLLPLLGLALWMVPLMWRVPPMGLVGGDAGGMAMSDALRYVFGIWMALVVAGFFLWRKLRGPDPEAAAPEDTAERAAGDHPRDAAQPPAD